MWTEAEAKTKWCPEARQLYTAQVLVDGRPKDVHAIATTAINGIEEKGRTTCIASACMMWRWARKLNPNYEPPLSTWPERVPDKPMYLEDREQGYCGKGGRP